MWMPVKARWWATCFISSAMSTSVPCTSMSRNQKRQERPRLPMLGSWMRLARKGTGINKQMRPCLTNLFFSSTQGLSCWVLWWINALIDTKTELINSKCYYPGCELEKVWLLVWSFKISHHKLKHILLIRTFKQVKLTFFVKSVSIRLVMLLSSETEVKYSRNRKWLGWESLFTYQ